MPPKKYPPEVIADALTRYAAGERVADISFRHCMPPATLYYHIDRRARQMKATPPRRRIVVKLAGATPAMALARKLTRTAARAVALIDRRLDDPAQGEPARARDLNALGKIGRLMRVIASAEKRPPAYVAPDPFAAERAETEAERDVARIRAELSARMEEFLRRPEQG